MLEWDLSGRGGERRRERVLLEGENIRRINVYVEACGFRRERERERERERDGGSNHIRYKHSSLLSLPHSRHQV